MCKFFGYTVICLFLSHIAGAQPGSESGKLLKRLDLNKPGLEKVKEKASDSLAASVELLVIIPCLLAYR